MIGLEDKIREMIKAHAQEMRLGDKRAEQFYDSLFSGEANPNFATVGLIDTGGDHELYLKCNENLSADRILNLVVGDTARTITLSGSPTLGNWFDQSVKSTVTPKFASVQIVDIGADHYLNIKVNENFSAHRTLNLIPGNASRTITLSGNPTLGDWFDQSVKIAAGPTFASLTTTGSVFTGAHYYIPNAMKIYGRNVADTAYIKLLSINILDHTVFNVAAGSNILFQEGAVTQLSITSGGFLDLVEKMPRTDSRARAYLDTLQENLIDSTWTKVELDAEEFDTGNDFDSTTNFRYVAPITGWYFVSGQVTFSTIVADKLYQVGIYRSGSRRVQTRVHSSHTSAIAASVSDLVYLSASQYVELYAWQGSGGNLVDIVAGNEDTFLSVHLLSV